PHLTPYHPLPTDTAPSHVYPPSLHDALPISLLSLKVNDKSAEIALVFFGIYTLLTGYLVIKSIFLPRFLGWLGTFGGLGWLIFLYPPLAYRLLPYILGLGLIGSAAKILWLLVVGVNEQRWKEQASAAGVW